MFSAMLTSARFLVRRVWHSHALGSVQRCPEFGTSACVRCSGHKFSLLKLMFQYAPSHGISGHPLKLAVPHCNTDLHKISFSVRCVSEWNGLPITYASPSSSNIFKKTMGDLTEGRIQLIIGYWLQKKKP